MTYLLDTNIFLWAAGDPRRLSKRCLSILSDPESRLFVSVASLWEIAIKASLKRLTFTPDNMRTALNDLGVETVGISIEALDALVKLPPVHRDPFDRLIIAQTLVGGLTVVTADRIFGKYPKLKVIH